jgi:hypothetical protein
MKNRKFVVMILKFLVWTIVLYQDSKEGDAGYCYDILSAIFLSIGTSSVMILFVFWLFGKATFDHLYVSSVVYLLTGLVAHFVIKKEFGKSFLFFN